VSRLDRPDAGRRSADVVVVGGGIIGCAAAAIMADRGARVILVEGIEVGAGASGRNLGAIQHPMDEVLAPLYRESLTRYRALADAGSGDFVIGRTPAGLLLLNRDPDAAAVQAGRLADAVPELDPQLLDAEELLELEPDLAAGLAAVRLETGYPVPPAAATNAWAELADGRGARLLIGSPGRLEVADGRVVGVRLDDGTVIVTDAVLVAAGPWTPGLADPSGTWQPIVPTYGVTVQLRLPEGAAPSHIVEEDEVGTVNRAVAATERAGAADPDADPPSLFSLASARGISTLGSTFLPAEPDAARIAQLLIRRAIEFLPVIADAEVTGRRLCARPQSIDGRPFIGPVDGPAGLHVCAGHGPWGISTGPASAAIAARAILDGTPPPPELAADRPI
jgi:glycine/D-amino acid oxidase-like deaminating enzyme